MAVKRIAVLIDQKLHRRFKALAASKGLDMSDIMRELIEDYTLQDPPEERSATPNETPDETTNETPREG